MRLPDLGCFGLVLVTTSAVIGCASGAAMAPPAMAASAPEPEAAPSPAVGTADVGLSVSELSAVPQAQSFTGGGAGSSNVLAAPSARKGASPSPPPSPSKGAPTAAPLAEPHEAARKREAMIIYKASFTLAVYQVDKSLAKLEDLASSAGGYLATKTDTTITVRVPRDRFHEVVSAVEALGDVLHRQIDAEDVSDQMVDLEGRLKNARAMRDRLTQLLSGAPATKDALEIERELSRVLGEIESIEGKLTLLADRVAYSTLSVTFQPRQVSEVHSIARLPFPWLQELGLPGLLKVD